MFSLWYDPEVRTYFRYLIWALSVFNYNHCCFLIACRRTLVSNEFKEGKHRHGEQRKYFDKTLKAHCSTVASTMTDGMSQLKAARSGAWCALGHSEEQVNASDKRADQRKHRPACHTPGTGLSSLPKTIQSTEAQHWPDELSLAQTLSTNTYYPISYYSFESMFWAQWKDIDIIIICTSDKPNLN